jgi:hypothetical protein
MKKNVIIVVIVVLVIIGIFAFKGGSEGGLSGLIPGNDKVDVKPAPSILTASFECADGTKFTAEFPTEDEVAIKVDGALARTLSYVGPGFTFDGPGYTYVFSGEKVTVTDKATKKKVACTQPVVEGQTAVDFGDPNAKQDPVAIVKKSIIGKWQGIDGVNSIIEFTTAGKASETNANGQTTLSGNYTVFTKANAPKGFVADPHNIYIQIKGTGTNTQTVIYAVGEVESDMLILLTDKDEVRAYQKMQ